MSKDYSTGSYDGMDQWNTPFTSICDLTSSSAAIADHLEHKVKHG